MLREILGVNYGLQVITSWQCRFISCDNCDVWVRMLGGGLCMGGARGVLGISGLLFNDFFVNLKFANKY